MQTTLILDASAAIAFVMPDEKAELSHNIQTQIQTSETLVPYLWYWETRNTILTNLKRKRIESMQYAQKLINILDALITDYDYEFAQPQTFNLAKTHNLSIYDAAYLELALRKKSPLATLDKNLVKAAKKAGIEALN